MKKMSSLAPALLLVHGAAASAAVPPARPPAPYKFDGAALLRHITALASDEFEGRAPATKGETATLAYLQEELKKIGLAPGNPDGSYLQKVPLVYVQPSPTLAYTAAGKPATLAFPADYVAWSPRTERKVAVANSELVFVGYGVQAPEFKWDDYKGADVRGKTLVMLINDPPLPDSRRPGRLDAAQFGGAAMSYYGRWSYKFETAARLGAAGALIVHETRAAGYPYDVVRSSWGRGSYGLKSGKGETPPGYPAVAGWLQLDRARELFRAAGQDFDALKKAAVSRDFKPVPLGATASVTVANAWNEMPSNNVVAKIEGSDPKLKDEVVIYSAHWDHFGIDETLPGPRSKQIFHGALDNASGVAALLEVAQAYKALPQPPKRTVLFLLTTGEERGLLGAQYYARHPLYPLAKTVLNINVDGLNLWGKTRDVELTGHGKSTADDLVAAVAKLQGRVVRPEGNPELGAFYRSDQFEFAKQGVPVVYTHGGRDFIGKPPGYAAATLDAYTAHDYHKVTDMVQPLWDLGGALQDIELLFQVGLRAAQESGVPQWKPGAEFKSLREPAPAVK
ncbi:M20/M25/M40 family metallo-hydrolase [Pseudoduganella sp. LjRoot289]|uniref:M20/M25/M40 family metallo-hydrolase n=1 Tax=Pseudoduganella sp. LjRoot289 TaxID=3342314 RepID=UPI003ED00AA3